MKLSALTIQVPAWLLVLVLLVVLLLGAAAGAWVVWDSQDVLVDAVLHAQRAARDIAEQHRRTSEAAYPARWSKDPAVNAWLPDPAVPTVPKPETSDVEPVTKHRVQEDEPQPDPQPDEYDAWLAQLLTEAAATR